MPPIELPPILIELLYMLEIYPTPVVFPVSMPKIAVTELFGAVMEMKLFFKLIVEPAPAAGTKVEIPLTLVVVLEFKFKILLFNTFIVVTAARPETAIPMLNDDALDKEILEISLSEYIVDVPESCVPLI